MRSEEAMDLPLTGRCACGAVRYAISRAPRLTYACHCTECQRRSGGPMTVSCVVPVADFTLLAGRLAEATRIAESGNSVPTAFCPDCGTAIFGGRLTPDAEGVVVVRAGTLGDTAWLRPSVHVWTRSAQPWVVFPDGARRFETRPPVPVWRLRDDAPA
jgi:hypothetical protein